MNSLIGNLTELHDSNVVVPVNVSITGATGHFHVDLASNATVNHYLENNAVVYISGDLKFELSAPATSTVAGVAIIAVCPNKYTTWPTTRAQILALEGRVQVKDAILVPTNLRTEGAVREVSPHLKPKSLVGYTPVIVGHVTVAGGTATTVSDVTIHVPLYCDGLGHRKTW